MLRSFTAALERIPHSKASYDEMASAFHKIWSPVSILKRPEECRKWRRKAPLAIAAMLTRISRQMHLRLESATVMRHQNVSILRVVCMLLICIVPVSRLACQL